VPPTLETEDARARLLDAATTRASIQHPHLLRAHLVRNAEGRLGMVMERCSAPTLRELLAAGPFKPNASIMVLGCVASAAHALTSHGLFPRELTPDGILIHRRAGVILADHGLPPDLVPRAAPENDAGLAYRSPEELNGCPLDARSSVYSLGAVLLVCITGTEPPDPRRPAPRRWVPGSSPALDPVIERAMSRQPGRRYPDALALARAAHAAVRQGDQPASARTRKLVKAAAPNRPSPAVPAGVFLATRSLKRKAAMRIASSTAALRRAASGSARRARRVSARSARRVREQLDLTAVGPPPRRLIVAATVLVTASGGLAVIGVGDGQPQGHQPQQPQKPLRVSAGPLSLQLPSGWKVSRPTSEGSVPLSFKVSGTPSRSGDATMLAGVTSDAVAAERFLDDSRVGGAVRTQTRLGRLQAWHYAGLSPGPGLRGSAYVAYTTGPALFILCQAPVAEARAGLRKCAQAASTVRLRGVRPVAPAVEARRRLVAVRAALRDLDQARLVGRQRLAEAVVLDEQRAAARALQVDYRAALRVVERSGVRGARAGVLLAALREAGEAYGDLATAISEGDQVAYDAARAAVLDSEGIVWNETNR
jgi:hypothetical protein